MPADGVRVSRERFWLFREYLPTETLTRPDGAINGQFWKGDRYGLSERDHKDGHGNDRRGCADEGLFLCQVQVQKTQRLLIAGNKN